MGEAGKMKVIKLRRGLKETMPLLHESEIVYASDSNELFIGGANGNTTPSFDGGSLADSTKGRLILRRGTRYQISDLKPGELFYLEDERSLAIALENNNYIVLNQAAVQENLINQPLGE